MKHPTIIGAGGVASYLLPVLIKSFHPHSLTIVDKDKLEERNLDRQMFNSAHIGRNKAIALASQCCSCDLPVNIIEEWFDELTELPEDTDLIICVADNHLARKDALIQADKRNIPAVIGGNEYLDNEAYYYRPEWKGTTKDPRVRHPEILTAGDTGSPTACTGLAQEASPQLAVANLGCAAKILHLLWVWERFSFENHLTSEAIECLPYELSSSLTDHTSTVAA